MSLVAASDDAERRLAEALRARATGAGRPGPTFTPAPPMTQPPPARPAQAVEAGPSTRTVLLIALLIGTVIGAALGLLSLVAPGVLPTMG